MSIKPINGNLVVQPKDSDEYTESGIALPTKVQVGEKEQGLVISVSKGAPVKVGQEVIWKKWQGEPFKEDGIQYVLITEADLLAVITA